MTPPPSPRHRHRGEAIHCLIGNKTRARQPKASKNLLFLQKKQQKNSGFSGSAAFRRPAAKVIKSFVLVRARRLFFRNKILVSVVLFLPSLAYAAPPVTITKPWIRYLLPSIPAAGYMTVHNAGAADAILTGASSPSCGMLMLHKSQDSSGMAMMMDMQTITIPAHSSVTFQPGGYHLMCMSPAMKLGDTVKMTLSFQDGSTMTVSAPVYGAQTSP